MPVDLGSLRLRPIALADAARVHEWASVPDASRYQPWSPNTPAEMQSFVEAAVAAWSALPQTRWTWTTEDSEQYVVGIGEVGIRSAGRAEISYAVDVPPWGLGVGTTIGRLLVE
jgi:ribosomal-protein-alanine N-acetyltransferase